MSVAQWIVGILLMLSAIVMIVTVLMQSSERTGIGAVSGAAETFFGKNKARGMDAKLALVTKICTGLFVGLSIVMMLLD
ncbi:MAG TPA: preprotein translocase subunit SecG [Candidatus Limiplasma sp.]|jgi:preprotein translocase subunit SecG|nr:preprotein translocase subunit SecG [Candidatus Limiplasma sp.]HPR77868.1 preprotein translocase subunit SecG [Candidatus Limiplasma sp.]